MALLPTLKSFVAIGLLWGVGWQSLSVGRPARGYVRLRRKWHQETSDFNVRQPLLRLQAVRQAANHISCASPDSTRAANYVASLIVVSLGITAATDISNVLTVRDRCDKPCPFWDG